MQLSNWLLPCLKMGESSLGNIRVWIGPSIPEPDVFLQLAGSVATEWQVLGYPIKD